MLAVFSDVARAELRRHAWSFAMDRTTLAADSTPPKFDYSNAFVLPGDYLRLVVLNDLWIDTSIREAAQEDLPIYTIEGKRILANLDAPLRIRYVTDVTNAPDTWDALFCEVFALALARAAAPTLVKSEARIKTPAKIISRRCSTRSAPTQSSCRRARRTTQAGSPQGSGDMTRYVPIWLAFNAGELSANMDGRTDQDKYRAGCKTMLNAIPCVQGPARRRGGTRYLGNTKNNGRAWLHKFEYSARQSYALEFGAGYVRFWVSRGQLLNSLNTPYEIVSPITLDMLEAPDKSCAIRSAQMNDAP